VKGRSPRSGRFKRPREHGKLPPVAHEQYGLKKAIEHNWMVIGIAKTCRSMPELKDKMAEMYGKVPA